MMLINFSQSLYARATKEQVTHVVSLLDVLDYTARFSSDCAAAYQVAKAFVQAAEYGKATANRYADLMTLIRDAVVNGANSNGTE